MNVAQILRRVMNLLMRRASHSAINSGIDLTVGKGKPADQMTPQERRLARQARQTAKKARQLARFTRRF